MKKTLRKMEAEIIIVKDELNLRIDEEIKETISLFEKIIDDCKSDIVEAKRSF